VGEVRVNCGRLGNYSSVENLCAPKACSAGVTLPVTFRSLSSSVTTSIGLAHLQQETTSCSAINEALRGDLRIDCQYGDHVVDTSSCYMVCLPSRPTSVIFAGQTTEIATPQELMEGKGFFKPCSDLATGYAGSVSATCNAGTLEVDVAMCEWRPQHGERRTEEGHALAELCGEFSVPVQGLRKDQLIDILFEIDNAATFGAECKSSPLGFEDLLAVCVKARVRYFRQKKALSSDQFPSFEGLWHDLTFLNSSSSPKTSQGLQ
ncbi:unnamed protein product, partial [Durusdinium trenchii]